MSVGRTSNGYAGNLSGPAYDLAPFWPRWRSRAPTKGWPADP